MSQRLFGSSGIRGVVNIEVTPALALRIGMALASHFEEGTATVGTDTRGTGQMLERALVAGLNSCGTDVNLLGVVPTPVTAYLTRELRSETGVAISASHNPPQYNGLKLFDSSTMAYTEEGQQMIEALIGNGNFKLSEWDNVGAVSNIDARWMYIDTLSDNIDLDRKWRVVCDLFNGATCTIASHVFENLSCDTILLNSQPDGSFPAGEPEPTPKSLLHLGKIVRALNADIGFGFDGDGDRMMPVDKEGNIHKPDRVLAAYAGYVVRQRRRAVVVTHVGTSMCIEEKVKEAGGTVVRTKVGDVSIATTLREHGAVFGGEPVGAWIHPEVHLCPDGVLSALKLLKALEEDNKTLTEFVADVPEYPLFRAKIPCPNVRKAGVMETVKEVYQESFCDVLSISVVDGVRLNFEDSWVLIRPSGTEPVIRITVEAKIEEVAQRLMDRSQRLIKDILVKIR